MSYANACLPIIGIHESMLTQKFGLPRQSGLVDLPSRIKILPPYNNPAAFAGITNFSHIWILWQAHHNPIQSFKPTVRPPRLGGNQRVGVFASRSVFRPSRMGQSVVVLKDVCQIQNELYLRIQGADFIHATPILDIKPYLAYADAVPNAHSGYAASQPRRVSVTVSQHAYKQFVDLNLNVKSRHSFTNQDLEHIKALIAQDPRPAYRKGMDDYVLKYAGVDVYFSSSNDGFEIIAFKSVDV